MATTTPSSPPTRHTASELFESVADGTAAFGLAFMSFLGAVPGLLPMVALTLLAVVILVIPAVVVGAVVGLPVLLARLVVRRASRRWVRDMGSVPPDSAPPLERSSYTSPATRSTAPVT